MASGYVEYKIRARVKEPRMEWSAEETPDEWDWNRIMAAYMSGEAEDVTVIDFWCDTMTWDRAPKAWSE
jgi:hypothetical protein